ncbi:MAG TPA: hypothetical protein VD907_06240 [Verrucomicrobiae bacterium]|nr:hypothetical protein [Verrucomicrobiae bacterium]
MPTPGTSVEQPSGGLPDNFVVVHALESLRRRDVFFIGEASYTVKACYSSSDKSGSTLLQAVDKRQRSLWLLQHARNIWHIARESYFDFNETNRTIRTSKATFGPAGDPVTIFDVVVQPYQSDRFLIAIRPISILARALDSGLYRGTQVAISLRDSM